MEELLLKDLDIPESVEIGYLTKGQYFGFQQLIEHGEDAKSKSRISHESVYCKQDTLVAVVGPV